MDTWWQTGKVLYANDYRIIIPFCVSGFQFVAVDSDHQVNSNLCLHEYGCHLLPS